MSSELSELESPHYKPCLETKKTTTDTLTNNALKTTSLSDIKISLNKTISLKKSIADNSYVIDSSLIAKKLIEDIG